ncbi:hypothetical protein [Thalassolituus oleivorans]|uniref:hypothetical protein n=1 Tax=Thalassolituus oleivorans TaxID=187493 RepID=UPI001CE2431C|nr:hypothetical protein [Thalassolituus oleivorans]MCA6128737.1 hypothetical protein [Thalassolituus oleivorans 4BN06-13]
MAMRVLIIEDQEKKSNDIIDFLNIGFSIDSCVLRKSYRSGLKEIKKNIEYDLLVLDMSMPSFDPSDEDPTGGRPESFAGKKILEYMKIRKINIPALVISQYSKFDDGSITLENLDSDLKSSFPSIYIGTIYYTSAASVWKSELGKLITHLLEIKNDQNTNS